MIAGSADLEALEPLGGLPGDAGDASPKRPRRSRRPWAALVVVALAVAVVAASAGAYVAVARRQVAALADDWDRAQGATVDVAGYVGDVRSGFAPAALASLGPALARSYAEEADRIGALGRRVRARRLVVDPGARDLRRRMAAALGQREADYRALASSYRAGDLGGGLPLEAASRARRLDEAVAERLSAERRRWRLPPAVSRARGDIRSSRRFG